MINESDQCGKLIRHEFPLSNGRTHPDFTVFSNRNNGSIHSVSFDATHVTITEESYSGGDTWQESEIVPLSLFTASEGERLTMIQKIINDRFHARVQELRAEPAKQAAAIEAKERAEYERLRAKYGVNDAGSCGIG
jgi:hypothetical protein